MPIGFNLSRCYWRSDAGNKVVNRTISLRKMPVWLRYCGPLLGQVLLPYRRGEVGLGRSKPCNAPAFSARTCRQFTGVEGTGDQEVETGMLYEREVSDLRLRSE